MDEVFINKKDIFLKVFSITFLLTGVLAFFIFPLGNGEISDLIHGILSLKYLSDHIVSAELLNMKSIYKYGFIISLILTIIFKIIV